MRLVCRLMLGLACLTLAGSAGAATVLLTWNPPSTNVDGTPVHDLAGYLVSQGDASGDYRTHTDVGLEKRLRLDDLEEGRTYYWAVRAYDTSLNQGPLSAEAVLTIPALVPEPPDPPVEPPPERLVVRITEPRSGETVRPQEDVLIQATSPEALAVSLQVNGHEVCLSTVEPFSCVWRVPSVPGRAYVLEALVSEGSGFVVSAPVVVTTTP